MKIEGRCRICRRDFPIDLILAGEAGGHCPFCGTPLDPHYSGNLLKALSALQRSTTLMQGALEQVRNVGSNLEIDAHSVLEPIQASLAQRAQAGRAAGE